MHTTGLGYPQCPGPDCEESDKAAQRLLSGVWEQALNLLFPQSWQARRKVRKPNRLPATVQYTQTDSTVLLLCVHFSALLMRRGKYPRFDELVKLKEQHGVLIARMCSPNPTERLEADKKTYTTMHDQLRSATRRQMEAILSDNWQDYPEKLREDIANPIQSQDDWRRGGWIVAVGMSCKGWDSGSPLLRPHSAKRDGAQCLLLWTKHSRHDMHDAPRGRELRPSAGHSHFDDPSSTFQKNKDLIDALAMTERFRTEVADYLAYHTRFYSAMERSPLFQSHSSPGCVEGSSAEDRDFVVDLFNRRRNLSNDERERLEPILREVCRTALAGMICVFRFYNRREFIEEPSLLKEYRRVYLEDSPRLLVEDD